MQALGLNEIRKRYLEFFEKQGHLCLKSFSLVPQNDPSILLINAGMTPLKPYFTGDQVPPRTRVTTCQKCIRTPDIERVGLTSRHGTYFEMLGNFSFGDYFKKEAITFAWEFLTKELEMPVEKLYVTVYHEDDEAYNIWHKDIGLPAEKIYRLGKEDNFWEHGTGPCGPCSEIYFDRGVEYGPDDVIGGDGDRFVEFWNLVFSQYDRQEDGSYLPLKQKNIDTGGGLERFACIMQGVSNLFEVDTVAAILKKASAIANKEYKKDEATDVALRVITDHARSTTMMISDGILPSNEGRGYVLRRLLRRAARFGRKIGIKKPFLHEIVEVVIAENQEAYPELQQRKDYILKIVMTEEKRFEATIEQGLARLEELFSNLKEKNSNIIAGDEAFKLHDTFGFPIDLTKEIASENGFTVDIAGFQKEMEQQKERAREALKNKNQSAWGNNDLPKELQTISHTEFVGYEQLAVTDSEIISIIALDEEGKSVLQDQIASDTEATLILNKTPFYATSGGQEGDSGLLTTATGTFKVKSCTKTEQGIFLHHGIVTSGYFEKGQQLKAEVDQERRKATARNHSATHLLHKALKDVLGKHVSQAGSYQNDEKIRFDFNHTEAISKEELEKIEKEVNQEILKNHPVITEIVSLEEAKKAGAMALFGEKYGSVVRMVRMGDSLELCGGTHVVSTAEIAYFRILSESSVASGIRRIEACAGLNAISFAKKESEKLIELENTLKVTRPQLTEKVNTLLLENKNLALQIKQLNEQQALAQIDDLLKNVETGAKDIRYLAAKVEVNDVEQLKLMAEQMKNRLEGAFVILLASVNEEKVNFVVLCSKEAVNLNYKAGIIVKELAQICGGGGGGRPDFAQAGGKEASKLNEAFSAFMQKFL